MWPSIIGAVGSLFGGLLNSSSNSAMNAANIGFQRETNQQNQQFIREMNKNAFDIDSTKVRRLVEDAKAAGIHPLAALGSTVAGSSAMPVAPSFTSPVVAGSSAMGDSVGDAFAQLAAGLSLKRQGLENELLAAQVGEARSRSVIAKARAAAVGGPGSTLAEHIIDPQRTSHVRTPLGVVMTNPNTSDAQTYEDRYGDIVENVAGVGNLISDLVENNRPVLQRLGFGRPGSKGTRNTSTGYRTGGGF